MCSILCVKLKRSICLCHGDFTVVFWQDGEFDYFAVKSSETFEWELCSVVYFDLWAVDSGSDDVTLVFGDLDLVGGDIEIEILDQLDSFFELFVVAKGFMGFLGLL